VTDVLTVCGRYSRSRYGLVNLGGLQEHKITLRGRLLKQNVVA